MWGGREDSSDREQEKHLELTVAVGVRRGGGEGPGFYPVGKVVIRGT